MSTNLLIVDQFKEISSIFDDSINIVLSGFSKMVINSDKIIQNYRNDLSFIEFNIKYENLIYYNSNDSWFYNNIYKVSFNKILRGGLEVDQYYQICKETNMKFNKIKIDAEEKFELINTKIQELDGKIKKISDEYTSLEKKRQKLEEDQKSNNIQVSNLQNIIQQLNDKINKKKTNLQNLQDTLKQIETENKTIDEKIQENKRNQEKNEKDIKENNQNQSQIEKQISEIEKDTEYNFQECLKLQSEIKKHQDILDELECERQKLQQEQNIKEGKSQSSQMLAQAFMFTAACFTGGLSLTLYSLAAVEIIVGYLNQKDAESMQKHIDECSAKIQQKKKVIYSMINIISLKKDQINNMQRKLEEENNKSINLLKQKNDYQQQKKDLDNLKLVLNRSKLNFEKQINQKNVEKEKLIYELDEIKKDKNFNQDRLISIQKQNCDKQINDLKKQREENQKNLDQLKNFQISNQQKKYLQTIEESIKTISRVIDFIENQYYNSDAHFKILTQKIKSLESLEQEQKTKKAQAILKDSKEAFTKMIKNFQLLNGQIKIDSNNCSKEIDTFYDQTVIDLCFIQSQILFKSKKYNCSLIKILSQQSN
ncbi:hypothetical protein ABPG74_020338 [Tetrahymena malaccensis]